MVIFLLASGLQSCNLSPSGRCQRLHIGRLTPARLLIIGVVFRSFFFADLCATDLTVVRPDDLLQAAQTVGYKGMSS